MGPPSGLGWGQCAGFGVPFPGGSACRLLLGSLGMCPPRLQFLLLVAYPGPPGFLRGQDGSQRPGPPEGPRLPELLSPEVPRGDVSRNVLLGSGGWMGFACQSPTGRECLQLGEQEGLGCPPRGRGPEAERGTREAVWPRAAWTRPLPTGRGGPWGELPASTQPTICRFPAGEEPARAQHPAVWGAPGPLPPKILLGGLCPSQVPLAGGGQQLHCPGHSPRQRPRCKPGRFPGPPRRGQKGQQVRCGPAAAPHLLLIPEAAPTRARWPGALGSRPDEASRYQTQAGGPPAG